LALLITIRQLVKPKTKQRRSKWEWKYEPDEPEPGVEPYSVNLPKGMTCDGLTGTSVVSDLINDFLSCGYCEFLDGETHDRP
jgi:hypothetical protein